MQLTEWTNYLLSIHLQAAAANVPFLPVRVAMGTDTFRYGAGKVIECSGYRFDDIQENCGFELLQADKIVKTAPPTDRELEVLRNEVDPYRYVIGRA